MRYLDRCPACGDDRLEDLYRDNDLAMIQAGIDFDPRWARSDYALCHRCGLLFARHRQSLTVAAEYYAAFAHLEHRWYTSYPPPLPYLEGKAKVAGELITLLDEYRLLQPPRRVLHIRCDAGTLLARLRDECGIEQVFGLDYFDTNVRFAREELRLAQVDRLTPGEVRVPFAETAFDLILSNHQVTHAFAPLTLLRTLRALLAPGGTLLLYNEADHLELFATASLRGGINNYHKQLLTETSLLNLCRLAGLEARVVGRRHRNTTMVALAGAGPETSPEDLSVADHRPLVRTCRSWIRRHERSRRPPWWRLMLAPVPGARSVRSMWRQLRHRLPSKRRPVDGQGVPKRH